jgi:spore maturation protein SpmB
LDCNEKSPYAVANRPDFSRKKVFAMSDIHPSAVALSILRTGLNKGLRSLLRLAKFVLPVVFLLALFQHTVLFEWLVRACAPLTHPLGLPGDAALLLLTGLLLNKFAGISGLLLLPLSPGQFFTAAVFLSLAHNLVMEGLIVWQSRLPVLQLALIRVGVAYAAAWLSHLLLVPLFTTIGWLSSAPNAGLIFAPPPDQITTGPLLLTALWQAVRAVGNLALYLLPLFLLLEALKQTGLMSRLEQLARPLTSSLRLSPALTPALLGGLLLGVATGAGVIEQAVRDGAAERSVSRRELWRLNLFLLHFHSLFEDTLMFALFPVPILLVALVRFAVAWVAARCVRFTPAENKKQSNQV